MPVTQLGSLQNLQHYEKQNIPWIDLLDWAARKVALERVWTYASRSFFWRAHQSAGWGGMRRWETGEGDKGSVQKEFLILLGNEVGTQAALTTQDGISADTDRLGGIYVAKGQRKGWVSRAVGVHPGSREEEQLQLGLERQIKAP